MFESFEPPEDLPLEDLELVEAVVELPLVDFEPFDVPFEDFEPFEPLEELLAVLLEEPDPLDEALPELLDEVFDPLEEFEPFATLPEEELPFDELLDDEGPFDDLELFDLSAEFVEELFDPELFDEVFDDELPEDSLEFELDELLCDPEFELEEELLDELFEELRDEEPDELPELLEPFEELWEELPDELCEEPLDELCEEEPDDELRDPPPLDEPRELFEPPPPKSREANDNGALARQTKATPSATRENDLIVVSPINQERIEKCVPPNTATLRVESGRLAAINCDGRFAHVSRPCGDFCRFEACKNQGSTRCA